MNESEPPIPHLPPKRKSAHTDTENLSSKENSTNSDQESSKNEEVMAVEDPELLAALKEALENTPSHIEIDLADLKKKNSLSAPILEPYIDPFTVPINYLLTTSRMMSIAEDFAQSGQATPDETDKQE